MKSYPWRQNVRFDPTMGEQGTFMLKCEECSKHHSGSAFWPLTLEFWDPSQGLQRCRSCHRAQRRHRRAQTLEELKAKARARYAANRPLRLAQRRTYYALHSESINARRRELYAARKAPIDTVP